VSDRAELASSGHPRRLIEVDLPIRRISAAAKSETRSGHIRGLHTWWARRPLAACRAVVLAALWPDPADQHCPPSFLLGAKRELGQLRDRVGGPVRDLDNPAEVRTALLDFIADFATWENGLADDYLRAARELTRIAHASLARLESAQPLVVDPFAGGGAIPHEALRVGAEVFAADLNPVAALINTVLLDAIPKYRDRLAETFEAWSEKIIDRLLPEVAALYPESSDSVPPYAYIWARTIRCEGPACGVEVPVSRSLALDARKKSAAYLHFTINDDAVMTRVANKPAPAQHPTARRGSVTCPKCGYTTPRKRVEEQAQRVGLGSRLLAVAYDTARGRVYYEPTPGDMRALEKAQIMARELDAEGWIPHEELPYLRSIFNVHLYGMTEWGSLFSPRQAAFIGLLASEVAGLQLEAIDEDRQFARAVKTLLAFVVDKAAQVSCSVARWRSDTGRLEGAFAMQALPMVWDWAEINPLYDNANLLQNAIRTISEVVRRSARALPRSATVHCSDAVSIPLPDDSAALLFTDPPYYDYIPYADLSDFFYVWLRRVLGDDYPQVLGRALTPKDEELVQLAERNKKYAHKTKASFEEGMREALDDARRVVAPDGIACVVFAHKTSAGWESLLTALVAAGWTVTASWPIDTELTTRWKAIGTASLASSVHLACRPRETERGSRTTLVGEWRDVIESLPNRIHMWMPRLADEGIVGADAIFSCLGPALELFTRYDRVEKASGEPVSLREFLEQVWAAVAKEALSLVFSEAEMSGLEPDARLTAMWLWTLSTPSSGSALEEDPHHELTDEEEGEPTKKAGFSLEFDAARKIAQGLGANLETLSSVVEVKGDVARLRGVAERTAHLFGGPQDQGGRQKKADKAPQLSLFTELARAESEATWGRRGAPQPGGTVLDRVHQAMILFAAGRAEALKTFLVEEGAAADPRFWRLSQSLSALYPTATDEKRWIDGVLARRKTLGI